VLNTVNPGKPSQVEFSLAGSETSPIVNPAFVIQGWGERVPTVKIDGAPVPRGKDCRLGVNHKPVGADLVVWLQRESTLPMTVTLTL
jgi:hypothetical protein